MKDIRKLHARAAARAAAVLATAEKLRRAKVTLAEVRAKATRLTDTVARQRRAIARQRAEILALRDYARTVEASTVLRPDANRDAIITKHQKRLTVKTRTRI